MAKRSSSSSGPTVRGKVIKRARSRRVYYSAEEAKPVNAGSVEDRFASRLHNLMQEQGWNGAQLAVEAQKFMPDGEAFGRHLISNYLRGANLPRRHKLTALCRALRVKPGDLVPDSEAKMLGRSDADLDLRVNQDRAHLRIDRDMSTETALKIVALINAEKSER